jgi:hypothetical protein
VSEDVLFFDDSMALRNFSLDSADLADIIGTSVIALAFAVTLNRLITFNRKV